MQSRLQKGEYARRRTSAQHVCRLIHWILADAWLTWNIALLYHTMQQYCLYFVICSQKHVGNTENFWSDNRKQFIDIPLRS